jgi:hypothetical protein
MEWWVSDLQPVTSLGNKHRVLSVGRLSKQPAFPQSGASFSVMRHCDTLCGRPPVNDPTNTWHLAWS